MNSGLFKTIYQWAVIALAVVAVWHLVSGHKGHDDWKKRCSSPQIDPADPAYSRNSVVARGALSPRKHTSVKLWGF